MTTSPESYFTALAMLSDPIVQAVHGRRDPRAAIVRALSLSAPEGVDKVVALATVLAAQAHPMFDLQERLRWVKSLDPELRAA